MTLEERIEDLIAALERIAAALEELVKLEEHAAGRRACGW